MRLVYKVSYFYCDSVAVTTWRETGQPKMQQPVIEEGAAYEPSLRSYDDLFPALPESAPAAQNTNSAMGKWNNKMRVGSSIVTQVFR